MLFRSRDRELFRADVRAILELSTGIQGFSSELSDLADALLRIAFPRAIELMAHNVPIGQNEGPGAFALFALGKLGGRELGFASDLELLLVYDDQAADTNAVGTAGYFDLLVKSLRHLLSGHHQRSFELDFRLRPYGRSGPLATSLSAFRSYYSPTGPAWSYERQALVKLRAVTGDEELASAVLLHRDHFVYGPEPFDFSQSRQLRGRQIQQLVRAGTINAKYSPGALVDIEYFVQALQIVHGASNNRLRTPSTVDALIALNEAGLLSTPNTDSLRSAYVFFRTLIDALRIVHGQARDLTVPELSSREFALLSRRLHFPHVDQLQATLKNQLEFVRQIIKVPRPDFQPARD